MLISKRLAQKIKAIDYLGTTCEQCGTAFHFSAMHFHHKRPEEKKHKLSSMFGRHSWEKIKIELNKCELLCANCHLVMHYKEHEKNKE